MEERLRFAARLLDGEASSARPRTRLGARRLRSPLRVRPMEDARKSEREALKILNRESEPMAPRSAANRPFRSAHLPRRICYCRHTAPPRLTRTTSYTTADRLAPGLLAARGFFRVANAKGRSQDPHPDGYDNISTFMSNWHSAAGMAEWRFLSTTFRL